MTVQQLIGTLSTLPAEAEVYVVFEYEGESMSIPATRVEVTFFPDANVHTLKCTGVEIVSI